jgi:hypothetical protein
VPAFARTRSSVAPISAAATTRTTSLRDAESGCRPKLPMAATAAAKPAPAASPARRRGRSSTATTSATAKGIAPLWT